MERCVAERTLLLALMALSMQGCLYVEPARHRGAAPAPRVESDVTLSGRVTVGDERAQLKIEFSSDDRRHIHNYYYREQPESDSKQHRTRKRLPPGLAKREQLPPGLQQQIQRNGRLPPGLEGEALPQALEVRLAPLPVEYIRLRVGRDIVLMDRHTRITVDVIKNIFP